MICGSCGREISRNLYGSLCVGCGLDVHECDCESFNFGLREYTYYSYTRKAVSGRRADLSDSGSSAAKSSPVGFLAKVPKGTHFAMFYENLGHARKLQLWYLMHGLFRNEDCVFMSYDSPEKSRAFLANPDFNIDYFERELGLLHIRQIKDPRKHRDGLQEGLREVSDTIFSGITHPVRVIGATIPVIMSEEESKINLGVENSAQDRFRSDVPGDGPYSICKGFNGSIMCSYALSRNRPDFYSDWITKCASCHDVTLRVPLEGRARLTQSSQIVAN